MSGVGVGQDGTRSGGGASIKQWGFDIKGSISYSKVQRKYEVNVDEIIINVSNGYMAPQATITYNVDTRMAGMLQLPYILTLTVIEKNTLDDPRSFMNDVQWLNISTDAPYQRREENDKKRADVLKITHDFVLYDGYQLANCPIGGVYHKMKFEDIFMATWGKTKHGKLGLEYDKMDNKTKYDQVGIPNTTGAQSFAYLAQRFGFYNDLPVIYADQEKFYMSSIKWCMKKYQPITIELLGTDSPRTKILTDKRHYMVPKLPTGENNLSMLQSTVPKNVNVIKHSKKDLYTEESIDVSGFLSSLKHVDTVDNFKNLDKFVSPKSQFIHSNDNMWSFKENLALLTGTSNQPESVTIDAPFRLNHFKIGTKVKIKPYHDMYEDAKVSYYIDEYTIKIIKQDAHTWDGKVELKLNTASINDFFKG